MKKFFAITGNLLAETTMTFDMPAVGATARALAPAGFQVGGKGVNASKAISAISRALPKSGVKAYSVIFPAGANGERCMDFLREKKFCQTISERVSGETRMGLVCVDAKTGVETTFLGDGIPIGIGAFKRALKKISSKAAPGDILALCGSFPGWSARHAQELRKLRLSKNLIFCADTYGAPLRDAANMKCDLLKINRREFFAHLARTCDNGSFKAFKNAFEKTAKRLNAVYFAVSDGENPALFKESGRETFLIEPPRAEAVSSTGCGDIMFACMAYELFFANTAFKLAAARAVKWASLEAGKRGICSLTCAEIARILKK